MAPVETAPGSVLGGDGATAHALAELEQRVHSLQYEVDRRMRGEALMNELFDITSELAQARTQEEIARLAIERASSTLGATATALWTIAEDGTALELLAASADERNVAIASYQRLSLDSDAPVAHAARTNESIFLGSLAEYRERFPASHERIERIRSATHLAFAIIPLSAGGTSRGALCFTFSQPRRFDEAGKHFKTILGRHLALALERVQLLERERAQRHAAERAALAEKQALEALARAYREEREAHILAEEATRAREEIISVVSHDLRNPLGTILMAATTLLNVDVPDRPQRARMAADRIHRQAMRMARLIKDLVDFAGIQAGRLELDPGIHAPDSILTTTSEIFGPIAQERGLTFATEVDSDLPPIRCDPDRAVQVLSNLVSNALKVTPKGGAIAIGAQPKDKEVVFYVRDTGPGIEPDEMPNLFERHWRGKQSNYKGTGLGLSIARGIVDAHGGRIWAESRVGSGAVFYFSLSPAN